MWERSVHVWPAGRSVRDCRREEGLGVGIGK